MVKYEIMHTVYNVILIGTLTLNHQTRFTTAVANVQLTVSAAGVGQLQNCSKDDITVLF
jgi:hypothetical protein